MPDISFILINARERVVRVARYETLDDAKLALGIDPSQNDHGTLAPGVAYVVYEFGFFIPVQEQRYFAIGSRLIAGNCVLYGYNQMGDTIDLNTPPAPIRFFHDAQQIEHEIRMGRVNRPRITSGSVVIWEWPQPAPHGLMG